jgi:hypothetical protein
MRSFLTSLIALIVSLFIGELIAQVLAVETGGTEEWIVVFGMAMFIAAAVTVVFFVIQLAFGSRKAANVTAIVLSVIFAGVIGAIVWASFASNTGATNPRQDLAITCGLALSGLAIIIVQWLIVRWRAPREPQPSPSPRFGRQPT